ncbi:hypothetical protein [Pseudarthrobacter sp. S6]|uniref:hypothetical protein n=1 Tax=Pseudarthrobacter sp. S6 TaxID=3418420 RepID=UPI003CFB4A23
MTREPEWTDRVYRVTINHQYADGNGYYQQRKYGPYTTLKAARSQLSRHLRLAGNDYRKADGFIESSALDWDDTP